MEMERMITKKMIMGEMIIRTCFLFCYANMTPPLVPAVVGPWSLSSPPPIPYSDPMSAARVLCFSVFHLAKYIHYSFLPTSQGSLYYCICLQVTVLTKATYQQGKINLSGSLCIYPSPLLFKPIVCLFQTVPLADQWESGV